MLICAAVILRSILGYGQQVSHISCRLRRALRRPNLKHRSLGNHPLYRSMKSLGGLPDKEGRIVWCDKSRDAAFRLDGTSLVEGRTSPFCLNQNRGESLFWPTASHRSRSTVTVLSYLLLHHQGHLERPLPLPQSLSTGPQHTPCSGKTELVIRAEREKIKELLAQGLSDNMAA